MIVVGKVTARPRTGLGTRAGRAVAGLAVRQTWRAASVVIILAAGLPTLVAATYRSTVGSTAAMTSLAAVAENPAIRTLFGAPVALGTAGGFVVWRTGTVLAVLLSVWGLLAATRVTRGEEDTGRWGLLLGGRLSAPQLVAGQLSVLIFATLFAGLAVIPGLLLVGTGAEGAVEYGVGLALTGMFSVAVGGLAAQIFAPRSAATGAGITVLGMGMLLRMVGDGLTAVSWLRWASPYGLTALARPYANDRVLPLLVLAVAVAVVLAVTVLASCRRDGGDGVFSAGRGRGPRLALLDSVESFAVRRGAQQLLGWALGIGAYYLLIGLLVVSLTGFLADNPQLSEVAGTAGFAGLDSVTGYAAALFALLALPVDGFVSVRLAAAMDDEAAGRQTMLYALPVSRLRMLTAESGATLVGAGVLVTVAGAATWLGATLAGADLGPRAALAGAWNVTPIVLLSLGAAVFGVGWAPRAVLTLGLLPSVGGFLVLVAAQSTRAPGWVGDLSPFAHLAPVPLASPAWAASVAMTALALALAVLGGMGHRRRDLRA